jgi:uncharacterized protein (TIGR02757 family)
MARGAPATRLQKRRAALLRERLNLLQSSAKPGPDPIDFARRYSDTDDQEVAALLASSLAFGRVASFWPVLDRMFALADEQGGPAEWARRSIEQPDDALEPLFYRWVRGPDLQRWTQTIGRFRAQYGSVASFVALNHKPDHTDIGPLLAALISALRTNALDAPGQTFGDLPRGFRHLLPHPESGSACKRWCMFARWMTRTESPDLGLWSVPTSQLIIPLDTHIHRVAQFIGLTRRKDGSWRTAVEITQNLRRIDAEDPTRFDFVLAHLGISGTCKGRRVAEICDPCALITVCKTGRPG